MKGLPKTKRCNMVAITVSVRFQFGFGVYVKQPLHYSNKGRHQINEHQIGKHLQRKMVNMVFSISFNICFVRSKELSQ